MSLLAPATPVPSLIPGGGLLPIPTPAPLQNVSQHLFFCPLCLSVSDCVFFFFLFVSFHVQLNLPVVNRMSAGLDATPSVSQPPLMGNVDPSKIDEIRRTVYVGNLNSQVTSNVKSVFAPNRLSTYSSREVSRLRNKDFDGEIIVSVSWFHNYNALIYTLQMCQITPAFLFLF